MSTKLSSGSTGFPMSRTVPSISGRQSLVLISLFLLSNIIFRYFFFLSKRSTSTNRRNPTELVFLSLSLSSRSFHRLLFSSFSRPLPLPSSSSSSSFRGCRQCNVVFRFRAAASSFSRANGRVSRYVFQRPLSPLYDPIDLLQSSSITN